MSGHEHKWMPNGTVTEDEMAYSPVSANDHQVRTLTYAIQSCECGAVRKVRVAATAWRRLYRRRS